jgi:hypothetical protein
VRQASWCDPAGGRPVQVRGSARLVASVAWSLATSAKAGWSTPSRWQRRTGEGWCWAVGRSPAPPSTRRWRRTGSRISGGENHEAPAAAAYGNRVQHSSQGGWFRRRAHTNRRHERSVPRLRDHARPSRARARPPRTLGDPRTRGRDRAAAERSLARFLQSVARAQPRPPPHLLFTARVLWGMRQRGDGRMARRLFALLVPTPSPQPRLPLSAVSNLAQIGRRESATIPHGES